MKRTTFLITISLSVILTVSQVFAAAPVETSFWSYSAPEGADYKAYCFNSGLPEFEGAYIRFPSVYEQKENGRYLTETQIVAADGASAIRMIASGKEKGNAFLLYDGNGIFKKFQMVGFTVSDEKGLEYRWGFYTRDVSTMDTLGLPASKDNAKRIIAECGLNPPNSQPFGYFKNPDLPLFEGVDAYTVSLEPLPTGLTYLKIYLKSANGTSIYNPNPQLAMTQRAFTFRIPNSDSVHPLAI